MLLNEFLKEHRKVEEQGTPIAPLEKKIEALTAVQKVNERIGLNDSASPAVAENRLGTAAFTFARLELIP